MSCGSPPAYKCALRVFGRFQLRAWSLCGLFFMVSDLSGNVSKCLFSQLIKPIRGRGAPALPSRNSRRRTAQKNTRYLSALPLFWKIPSRWMHSPKPAAPPRPVRFSPGAGMVARLYLIFSVVDGRPPVPCIVVLFFLPIFCAGCAS